MKHEARDTKHEARILVMAMMVVCSSAALAMPTQQELKKAQPLVAELMAPTMDDFKAKKKTAAEVADAAVKYADEAETEAAKFMLYRSSIPYYVRGEAYDKAAEAVVQLKANVKDVPAEVVAEIISKATVRANKEKAPRLFELYQQAKTQATAEKDVKELRKKPASTTNKRKLAEALATTGDWPEALKEFAGLTDQTAQMAKGEQDGSAKSSALGEFWWAYKPTYENAEDTFKIHAAVHYRKALAVGEITGLKKNIVEQRIKEYGNVVTVGGKSAAASAPAATTPSADSIELKTGGDSPFTVKGNEATLTLKSGVKLEFVKCPSGWVKVVDDYEKKSTRKVKITRPFWIMKRSLWNGDVKKEVQLRDSFSENGGKGPIHPGFSRVEGFCSDLTDDLKSVIPDGYVVRLPSIAEWEYAYLAGNENPDDEPFGSLLCNHPWEMFTKHAIEIKTPVNKWGLYDFNVWEKVLDRMDKMSIKVFEKDSSRIVKLPDCELKEDLFYWNDDAERAVPVVKCPPLMKLVIQTKGSMGCVRLVIGPDLVSEWKAKNAKK